MLAAQGTAGVGFALAIAGGFYLGRGSWVLLLVPLFWILQILFVTGLAWVLSLASLVLRDVQQLLAFVMVALLIASPIAYTPEMAPGLLKLLVYVNPLSYFVSLSKSSRPQAAQL